MLIPEPERTTVVTRVMNDPNLSDEDRTDVARKIAKNSMLSEEVRKKAAGKLPEDERSKLITEIDRNDY